MAHYDCPDCGTWCWGMDGKKGCPDMPQPTVTNTPDLVDVPLTTQNHTGRPKTRYYEERRGYEYHICDSAEGCSPDGYRRPIVKVDDRVPHYVLEAMLKAMNEAKPS